MKSGIIGYPIPSDVPVEQQTHWLIDRCVALEVEVLHARLFSHEPAYLAGIRSHLDSAGIELEISANTSYGSATADIREDLANAIKTLEVAGQLHLPILRVGGNGRGANRFTEPPLWRQLENYVTHLRSLVSAAEANGVVIAVENHCDYRADEIARIIEAVDSPWVRAALDTGNAYSVFDEPLADARNLARFAVTTHLKDMKIVRLGEPGRVPFLPIGCALGQGHVDLTTTLRLLAEQAPDAANLRLIVELSWVPGGTTAELFDESVRYLKQHFAEYLN